MAATERPQKGEKIKKQLIFKIIRNSSGRNKRALRAELKNYKSKKLKKILVAMRYQKWVLAQVDPDDEYYEKPERAKIFRKMENKWDMAGVE